MTYFERLVEAGIRPDCAIETCHWFRMQGNDSGLKQYVEEVEHRLERLTRKERAKSGL